jgi:glycolate oxidase/D-lactate dehydrogenase
MTKSKLNLVYNTDASQLKGEAEEVIVPETLTRLLEIVKTHKRIVPRGGGTGLAGGCIPSKEDLVLDLSKLNKILSFDEKREKVVVEAGIILGDLNQFLLEYGLEFPVKPSSWKACTIGGMIATDAVGSRAIKYGRTSRWVEWIDIVNAEGRIERKGKTEIADYSGMEGITGIIVSACLKLMPKKERTAELFSFDSIEEVLEKVKKLKSNEQISMIEFFDKKIAGIIGMEKKYYLIAEFESGEGSLKGKEYEKIMELRDSYGPLTTKAGFPIMEDPKIVLESFPDFMSFFEENGIPVFGHLSVGIIHPRFPVGQEKKIKEMMHMVLKTRGKVSGEHGIGIAKKNFLDAGTKNIYEIVKKRTDSQNKFNPGKII